MVSYFLNGFDLQISPFYLPLKITSKNFYLINLYFQKGQNDDINILLLPSGWLHLDTDSTYADSLGIENCKIVTHNVNRRLISINLKEIINTSNLRKLRRILRERVLVNKPLILTWYPNTNEVCPSTIAKYFNALGGSVTQKLPEIGIARSQSYNRTIPTRKTMKDSSEEQDAITVDDCENILGAAFLQLSQ